MEKRLEQFAQKILEWSVENPRPLPWKNFSDPYSIWIAEIILQQTRVKQGTPYFISFIEKYPTVEDLAQAELDEVLSQWEGLGYYSRARNLHQAARYIMEDLEGEFPRQYKDLLELKGVGPYTAAAVASFAFQEPVGVVDGNVKRVVSRYFGIKDPVDEPSVHKTIQSLVDDVVRIFPPADFNQAIMNFGAMQCIPARPDCQRCPLKRLCTARLENKVDQIPAKKKVAPKKEISINFGVFVSDNEIALIKNTSSNIWKGLYIFPEWPDFEYDNTDQKWNEKFRIETMDWILTHRKLKLNFYRIPELSKTWLKTPQLVMVKKENLDNFALPRPLRLFIENNSHKLGINRKK